MLENSGSIAEAALKLNDVFQAAQLAADQYLENVKQLAENSLERKLDDFDDDESKE